jgi:ribonuclease Z
VTETAHANVWKNRVSEQGLTPGPWLQELKQAILSGKPDEHLVMLPGEPAAALGTVRHLVTITAGQKIAFVTDVADTPGNRERIAALAENADTFFIEARFAADDAVQARQRAHLTTAAAGEIARLAKVRRVEPFHFSPRYAGEEERMITEVMTAFRQPLTAE